MMISFVFANLFIGILSKFVIVNAQQPQPQPGCDIGPNALTDARGYAIPQTCIPFDDGNGNTERCYYTFVPPCATDDSSSSRTMLPLVMDIHGVGSCPLYSSGYTGWFEKAIEECFVVVWPMGVINEDISDETCFAVPGGAILTNDGDDSQTLTPPCCCAKGENTFLAEPTDPDFLRAAIETVVDSFKSSSGSNNNNNILIDTTRIYMAGHSNGCISSLSMAALNSDIVAAVCCHAGTLITPFPSSEQPIKEPVPTWLVHGRLDDVIPYDGLNFFDNFGFWPIEEVVDYIADTNGCDEDIIQMNIVDESSGETGTIYKRSTNCTSNATVELLELPTAAHVPYIAPDFGETLIDTTAMAWEFCSSHSKVNVPAVFADDEDGTIMSPPPSTASPTIANASLSTLMPTTTATPSPTVDNRSDDLSSIEPTTEGTEDSSSARSYNLSAPLTMLFLHLFVRFG